MWNWQKLTGRRPGAFPHNPALVGRLSLPSAGRTTYPGAGRLRDVETVLQHLEARHDIACDRQDDRELRRSDLAGCLDPGLERTSDRGASVVCENVLDIERDGLRQRANIADEIDDGLALPIHGSTPSSPGSGIRDRRRTGRQSRPDPGHRRSFPEGSVQWRCSARPDWHVDPSEGRPTSERV